ncbi:MAG: PilZ domain-containing protein [Candidatus Omnitrophica bacterium]|nr:PilZ domain-containing protein [Candidatus Omnitrophota bacterium]
MKESFAEKRKHRRFDFRIPMRYRKIEASPQELKGTLIKDISQGGAKLIAYEFLPLNLRLAMEIPLVSGLKAVEGTARVAWVNKAVSSQQYDVGVEFVNLNHGDSEQLAKFIVDQKQQKVS